MVALFQEPLEASVDSVSAVNPEKRIRLVKRRNPGSKVKPIYVRLMQYISTAASGMAMFALPRRFKRFPFLVSSIANCVSPAKKKKPGCEII